MRSITQLLLALLILLKLILGSVFIHRVASIPFSVEETAIAADGQKELEGPPQAHENPANKEEETNLNFLLRRKAELKDQEEDLTKKKTELIAIQEEINQKIEILTRLRNEIKGEMARKEAVEEQKMKHLIKAYSTMKPQKAASLIEKLDVDFAIELLSRMKGDVAGTILSFVNVEKAAKISEGLAKRD